MLHTQNFFGFIRYCFRFTTQNVRRMSKIRKEISRRRYNWIRKCRRKANRAYNKYSVVFVFWIFRYSPESNRPTYSVDDWRRTDVQTERFRIWSARHGKKGKYGLVGLRGMAETRRSVRCGKRSGVEFSHTFAACTRKWHGLRSGDNTENHIAGESTVNRSTWERQRARQQNNIYVPIVLQ